MVPRPLRNFIRTESSCLLLIHAVKKTILGASESVVRLMRSGCISQDSMSRVHGSPVGKSLQCREAEWVPGVNDCAGWDAGHMTADHMRVCMHLTELDSNSEAFLFQVIAAVY